MKRLLAGVVSAVVLALFAGACDDSPRYSYGYGGGRMSSNAQCGQYSTCGTCTPALGCGWCITGAGAGLCVDDPGDCPAATTLGWTWDAVGCRGGASDASVLADARVQGDAGPTDAASTSFDASPDVY
jgi:hypothetical protein